MSATIEVRAPSVTPAEGHEVNDTERHVFHSSIRKRIAERMVESLLHTAPHVTTVFEVDLTAVLAHRARHRADFEKRGSSPTLTAYFIAACAHAIREVPEANSRFDKSRSPRSLMTDESGKPSAELGTCGMTLKSMRPPRFAGLFAAFANVIPFPATEPRCRRGDREPVVERFGQHLATAVLCWIRSV
ncbi:MAG TPA: 2-oxo acid dehydrogenase subunit E2 [Steroidobacteraceae bacterium]|nr:2-oxo acid dehydrogenase subunit E2 [Steroidobacteraceae bacterium]